MKTSLEKSRRRAADASGYSRLQRLELALISGLGTALVGLIGPTLRYEVYGEDLFALGPRPAIYTFWHNQIVCAVYRYRKERIMVLTSRHFDGEYIARIIRRLGYEAARGSSTRGALRGVLELVTHLEKGRDVAFTIDGPRGPRYRVKPGPIFLARKTRLPIVPFKLEPERFWELNSWDRLRIPKPFTRVVVRFGGPIYANDIDDEQSGLQRLQDKMDELRRICTAYFVKRKSVG